MNDLLSSIVQKWALSDEELQQLETYLAGKQLAMDYDRLSVTVQAAVTDYTRKQELLEREARIRNRCRPSDWMAAAKFSVPVDIRDALIELREYILSETLPGSLADYALTYIDGMTRAVDEHGEDGYKWQLNIILGNCKGLRGAIPRRLKKVLKEAAK